VDGDGVDDASPFATGSTLTVAPDAGTYLLTLDLAPRPVRLSLPCGRDRWAGGTLSGPGAERAARSRSPLDPTPVVCRGGWTSAHTFEADLVLIETPHRIHLRGDGSRLEASWNAPPLTGARLETQMPT